MTLQNEGDKKESETIDTKISLEDRDKDESKTSDDDTLKIDGSTVEIPEGKKVDKTLKVTEGENTFDTPQKDAGDERITPKAKKSGSSGTKRSSSGTLQEGKESTPNRKRPKRKTNVPDFFNPDQKQFEKYKNELNITEVFIIHVTKITWTSKQEGSSFFSRSFSQEA